MMTSELIQVAKFGLVGVWNTIFDLTIYFILYKTLKKFLKDEKRVIKIETLAHMISFMCANLVSYQLNSRFTFRASENGVSKFVPYFLISILSLGLSSVIINYLAKSEFFEYTKKQFATITTKYSLTKSHYAILIKVSAVVIVMAVNYFGYKYVVFR
jgi:putative flippase GtrA